MPPGPPDLRSDRGAQSDDHQFDDWRDLDRTRPLDIDGHDIWIFERERFTDRHDGRYYDPAVFGDLSPDPHGPDPDVWPLEYDPGAPADVEDLVRVMGAFPAPHVAWVTPEYLEARDGYDARSVEVDPQMLPPWKRPDGLMPGETVTITGGGQSSMTLTEDRKEALRRLAQLWNGDVVRGQHLLLDKCPRWSEVFGDLDDLELRRLFEDPDLDDALVEAFRDHQWFEQRASVFLKPARVLRRKVWWAPTLKAKTLINGRDDLPDLRGDPRERLLHRVTVGLAALFHAAEGRDVETYVPIGDYVVDLVIHGADGETGYVEVVTGHQNWQLHRSTYLKLADLQSRGSPYVMFDSRTTAYQVMNHWQRAGLAELPTGTFESEPRLSWAREKSREAFADGGVNWAVHDWATTDWLWRNTLGRDGLDVEGETVTSLDW
jgi:hypothetical protein